MHIRSIRNEHGLGMAGLLALGAAAFAAPAAADPILFPPSGSHSFIELYDTTAHVCPSGPCAFASSLGPSVSIPDVSISNPPFFMSATGSVSPTAIHSFVSSTDGVEFDLATEDTYTVHGGSGPFAITAHLDASGTTSTLKAGPFFEDVVPNISVIIGQLVIDPAATGIPIVSPFDSSSHATTVLPSLVGFSPQSAPISASTSYTRVVSPGDVFDIAYELNSQFALGTIDLSHTATISFDLPDGVFLTSAGGATFGTPPATGGGVPEPAAWALMIMGFGLAGATLRARARLAA